MSLIGQPLVTVFKESIGHPGNVVSGHGLNTNFFSAALVLFWKARGVFDIQTPHCLNLLMSLLANFHQSRMAVDALE